MWQKRIATLAIVASLHGWMCTPAAAETLTLECAESDPDAPILTLKCANSSISFDRDEGFLIHWFVNGVDQLSSQFSQSFFVNQVAADFAIADFGAGNEIFTEYSLPGQEILTVIYTLNPISKNRVQLNEEISVDSFDEPVTLIEYTDLNLGGTPDGDFAEVVDPSVLGLAILQKDGSDKVLVSSVGQEPDAFQIALVPELLLALFAQNPDALNNSGSGSGPGDLSQAFGWDLCCPPNAGFFTFHKTLEFESESIPEPSALVLIGLGVVGMFARRVRARRAEDRTLRDARATRY
jgi:hypothetical protein